MRNRSVWLAILVMAFGLDTRARGDDHVFSLENPDGDPVLSITQVEVDIFRVNLRWDAKGKEIVLLDSEADSKLISRDLSRADLENLLLAPLKQALKSNADASLAASTQRIGNLKHWQNEICPRYMKETRPKEEKALSDQLKAILRQLNSAESDYAQAKSHLAEIEAGTHPLIEKQRRLVEHVLSCLVHSDLEIEIESEKGVLLRQYFTKAMIHLKEDPDCSKFEKWLELIRER